MSHGTGEAATRRDGRGAPIAALAGGLVTFVTVFLPLAPVVGGAVAGYLRAGDARTGAWTGGLAGVVTVLLLAGLASGVLALLPVPLEAAAAGFPEPLGLALGVGGALLAAYVLVLSTLGGVCGSFAASEVELTSHNLPVGRDVSPDMPSHRRVLRALAPAAALGVAGCSEGGGGGPLPRRRLSPRAPARRSARALPRRRASSGRARPLPTGPA